MNCSSLLSRAEYVVGWNGVVYVFLDPLPFLLTLPDPHVNFAVGLTRNSTVTSIQTSQKEMPWPNYFLYIRVFAINVFAINVFAINVFAINVFAINVFAINVFAINVFAINVCDKCVCDKCVCDKCVCDKCVRDKCVCDKCVCDKCVSYL
jgi:hypothetical protein